MSVEFRNVTILLPAMDETYSLRETVDTIVRTCNTKDIAEFILLLCDRTSAESRAVANQLVDEYSDQVSIYIHDQKLPFVGGAIREGFDLAKGSHVVLMSSDLETDPNVIQKFIEMSKRYPNRIITATRWSHGGGFERYNKVKLVCNLIFERVIGLFYFSTLSDLTYAFRIFPTKLMQSIEWEELKHPFFLETALKPLRLGVKFIEIPAHWTARTEGVSQNSFFANFKYFKTAWHNRFLKKPQILRRNNV
ncbi:Glycosyltransferase involved in cell wall bisynthesis [Lachnospiraceae bacterium KH1T2]|nr:Glycosyltransferase involved in cell wall bisynthesis [Lachnospiraceae bacterium KH1T2]